MKLIALVVCVGWLCGCGAGLDDEIMDLKGEVVLNNKGTKIVWSVIRVKRLGDSGSVTPKVHFKYEGWGTDSIGRNDYRHDITIPASEATSAENVKKFLTEHFEKDRAKQPEEHRLKLP